MSNLIADGKHRALVHVSSDALQFSVAGEGENEKEQVVVLFDFIDPADPDHGRSITWFGFFTDKTFDKTIEGLRHCGWDTEELSDLPELAAAGKLCNEVELVIEHEEYQGEWQAKVRWVNRGGSGTIKLKRPLDGPQLAAFSARMRGRVRIAGTQPRVAAASAPRPAQPRLPAANAGSGTQRPLHPNAPGGRPDDDVPW